MKKTEFSDQTQRNDLCSLCFVLYYKENFKGLERQLSQRSHCTNTKTQVSLPRVMFSLCFYHDAFGTVFCFILLVFLLQGIVLACLLACLFVLRGKKTSI